MAIFTLLDPGLLGVNHLFVAVNSDLLTPFLLERIS